MNRRGLLARLVAVPVGIATGVGPAIAAGKAAARSVTVQVEAWGVAESGYRSAHKALMEAFEQWRVDQRLRGVRK